MVGRFTSGFPSRLVYTVFSPSSWSSTRPLIIIPEMNFTCSGVIVGYTIAGRVQGIPAATIQVFRENSSQPHVYYNISAGLAIDGALCVGELTQLYTNDNVFHCQLNKTTTNISFLPGDILGLEFISSTSRLAFARVTEGPTNYVFQRGTISIRPPTRSSTFKALPQVTLETESGKLLTMIAYRLTA